MDLRICMVSDFFYPNMGGIEEHVFNLSQCLIERGHKVIVITHNYGERKGVRWMTNGLKVYYVPAQIFYNGAIAPTLITLIPILRNIMIRERINIVHGHGAWSSLGHDALFVSKLLNLKGIFTDHSLFGFADASAVITNRFLQISLSDINQCICVSHVGKGNTVLRGNIRSEDVFVIPNAVDTKLFKPLEPGEPRPPTDRIIIIILCRLVYRKGVDLLRGIVPAICKKYSFVDFYIGGAGPKLVMIEGLREDFGDRVQIFGEIAHSKVRQFMVQGHIFLNTSLTEAYCMAIVEAAASGLQVVSTGVGGIPEVLPPELIRLASPTVSALVRALNSAIMDRCRGRLPNPFVAHQRISFMYNWREVTARTEVVYQRAIRDRCLSSGERINRYLEIGWIVGPLFALVFVLGKIILWITEFFRPAEGIDIALTYPNQDYEKVQESRKQKTLNNRTQRRTL